MEILLIEVLTEEDKSEEDKSEEDKREEVKSEEDSDSANKLIRMIRLAMSSHRTSVDLGLIAILGSDSGTNRIAEEGILNQTKNSLTMIWILTWPELRLVWMLKLMLTCYKLGNVR